jgi:outer membrane protein assembly factor BamD (BamD/ComL family)
MATTNPNAISPPAATIAGEDSPFMTPQRIRLFGIAGAVVLVIALAIWFTITAGRRKEAYAAAQLEQARDAAAGGNFGVAVQGFNKVATSYSGTPAAYEATLGIAQARLVNQQNELAVTGLNDFLKTNPPVEYGASANALLGTAYENVGKFAEALAAYRKSADLATLDYQKAATLLDAGRAAMLAKKHDEARAIYQEIVTKYPKTDAVTEAQLRLSELVAAG